MRLHDRATQFPIHVARALAGILRPVSHLLQFVDATYHLVLILGLLHHAVRLHRALVHLLDAILHIHRHPGRLLAALGRMMNALLDMVEPLLDLVGLHHVTSPYRLLAP